MTLLLLGAASSCATSAGPIEASPTGSQRGVAPAVARSAKSVGARFETRAESMLASVVLQLSARRGPTDEKYFTGGIWHNDGPPCWRCDIGPGTVAAVLARKRPHERRWFRLATETFDRVLQDHRQPDGSFGPPINESSNLISTMGLGVELGAAYFELADRLPPEAKARWRDALSAAAKWLRPSLNFYVNGNINIGETLFMYLAWHATRDPTLKDAYEQSLSFTLAPPQGRWPGYGLQYLQVPKRGDGSDGRGYLGEANGNGAPGFDPYYTILQADRAALLYVVSRDPRAKRLLNLLTNTLLSRTQMPRWFIDIGGGSRHPIPNRVAAFLSPSVAVAALAGGRRDLMRFVLAQLHRTSVEFRAYVGQHSNQHGVIGAYATALMAAGH